MASGRPTRAQRYARRRQRRLDSQVHDLTAAQWTALKSAWGGCAYCRATGVAVQKDCMLPIANGGRYTVTNVVPACRSCNASKCNVELTMWMRRKKFDENGFLLLQSEIARALTTPAGPPAVDGPGQTATS